MIRSRSALILALVVTLSVLSGAIAAGAAAMTPYSKQAFVDAQKADTPIVVFVHASW